MEAKAPDEGAEMLLSRRSEAIAALAFPTLIPHEGTKVVVGWTLAAISRGHEFSAWVRSGTPGWRITRARDGVLISESKVGATPAILSLNGEWLVGVPDGDTWELWDITQPSAKLKHRQKGNPEDLSDDGKLVAFTEWNENSRNVAKVQETHSGTTRFRINFPIVTVKMRFNPKGDLCAVAPSYYLNETDFPYTVRTHHCSDGSLAREYSSKMANCVWALTWSRDGSQLAASERGGVTRIWDALTGNTRHVFTGVGANLWQMPDNLRIHFRCRPSGSSPAGSEKPWPAMHALRGCL